MLGWGLYRPGFGIDTWRVSIGRAVNPVNCELGHIKFSVIGPAFLGLRSWAKMSKSGLRLNTSY